MFMRSVVRSSAGRFVLSVLALATVAGCATNQGVAPNRAELARLKEDPSTSIHALSHQPSPFVLMSAAKVGTGALFGLIGGAVAANSMQKAGEELIAEYGVADPALTLRDRIAQAMHDAYGVKATIHPPPDRAAAATDSLPELKQRFNSGIVLDTRTLGWQLVYYPADWGHHFVVYAGRARLLRLDDGKVLWDGRCVQRLPDPKESRRGVDDYRANGGELLRAKIGEAAEGCATALIAQLNGTAPPAR